MSSNSSFTSRFSNRKKNIRIKVGDVDLDQVTFGLPITKGPATFIPVNYGTSPLRFQVRGPQISFVGHSTKKKAMDTDLLERNFYFSLDASVDECPYMPGNNCDGPILLDFHQKLDEKFKEVISDASMAKKMNAVYKDPETKKPRRKSLIPVWSNKTPKLDENDEETGEYYPPSVMYKLRPATKDGNRIDKFTTTFKDRSGRVLDLKPSNINRTIPRGSYCILDVSVPRIWIGAQLLKFTVYLNEVKLVIVDNTEETDDFVQDESGEFSDDFKTTDTHDIDNPDDELAELVNEADDL